MERGIGGWGGDGGSASRGFEAGEGARSRRAGNEFHFLLSAFRGGLSGLPLGALHAGNCILCRFQQRSIFCLIISPFLSYFPSPSVQPCARKTSYRPLSLFLTHPSFSLSYSILWESVYVCIVPFLCVLLTQQVEFSK